MSLTKYAEFAVLAVESAQGKVLRETPSTNPFQKRAHRHEFKYDRRPGYIYVRSRAISSRTNDNFDEFPAEEIKQAYRTFVGKPVFVNHHNSNHRRARGVIIDAALHEDTNPDGTPDTWAEVLMEVDALRFPRLAEAVIAGDVARTSMGTDVAYSVCTACGNKASTPADYCQHIPRMKGMKIRRVMGSGQTEEVLIAERCYGLGFFENSLLVEPPADPTAFGWLDSVGEGVPLTAAQKVASIVDEQPVAKTAEFKNKRDFFGPGWEHINNVDQLSQHPTSESMESYGFHLGNDVVAKGGYDPKSFDSFHSEIVDVPLSEIRYNEGQSHVLHPYVEHLAQHPEAFWPSNPNDQPFGQRMPDGTVLIFEGHHRACAASLRGDRTLKMKVYGKWTKTSALTKTADEDQCPKCGEDSVPMDPDSKTYHCPECGSEFDGHRILRFEESLTAEARGVSDFLDFLRGGRDPENQCMECGKTFRWSEHLHRFVCPEGHLTRPALAALDQTLFEADEALSAAKVAAMQTTAYGEIKAPAQVDTLRADRCPVCKDDEAFNGEKCSVCGHVVPPQQFRDPDLTKAQEVDLRQDQQAQQDAIPGAETPGALDPDASQDLECTNCGEVFSAEGEPEADTDPAEQDPEAEADPEHPEDPTNGDSPAPAEDDDLSDLADVDEEDLDLDLEDDDEDEDEPPVEEDQPEEVDPAAPDAAPVDDPNDPATDDLNDVEIAPNMTCPVCGQGTLVPAAADSPEQPDVEGTGVDTMTEQQTAGQPNPAKQARNRIISALQQQQSLVTRLAARNDVLESAVRDLVRAAGVERHPRFASLMATAGDAPATTTEQAKKPQATDDVNNVGAAPGEANKDVTPAATTDVNNSNVAVDNGPVLDNLQDVTAPVGGTDSVVDKTHNEGEITSKAPSNDVMDPPGSSGWKTSARGEEQARFMASLRLARLQISAGLADGEDLTVAQKIHEGASSLEVIQTEVSTLERVAARQASAQPGQQHRHLVPQSSQRSAGVRSASLAPTAGIQPTAVVSGGRGEDEFMFGVDLEG